MLDKLMLDSAVQKTGEVLRDHMQVVYSHAKIIRLMTPKGSPATLEINMPTGEVDPYSGAMLLKNNINEVAFDCVVAVGAMKPTNRIAQLELLLKLREAGIVDNDAVLDEVEIDNKDEIRERVSMQAQYENMIQQAEQAIQNLTSEVARNQRDLLALARRVELEKTKGSLEVLETEAECKVDSLIREEQARRAVAEAKRDAAATVQKGK